jgi:imidazolonepropionase-like amidohydrolase
MRWLLDSMTRARPLVLGLCLAALGNGPARGDSGLVALVGATVVGQPKLGAATVLIRDGRIEQVGARAKVAVPQECQSIDVQGKFLIPGLVDLASECVDADCLNLNLYYGVTTLRTVGSFNPELTHGQTVAPRVVPAAVVDLAGTPTAGSIPIGGPDEVESVLTDVAGRGAAWVIAEPAVGQDLLTAIVAKARALGLKAGARLGATRLQAALGLKVDSIEHVTSLLTSELTLTPFAFQKDPVSLYTKYVVPQAAVLGLEEKAQNGAFREAGKSHVGFLPGLTSIEYPALRSPPQLDKLPGALQQEPERYGNSSLTLRKSFELMMLATRAFAEAGGLLGVGTHSPGLLNVPGYAVHREMELLVQAGLKPMPALEAATSGGAQILGLSDVGKIAPGMAADLVVLGADPTQDIAATQQIEQVLVAGQPVDRETLLQGGGSGGGEQLGSSWTMDPIVGFDEQTLDQGDVVHGEVFPASAQAMPKVRFIPNDDGFYVRLSGHVQGSEESGLRINLSPDGKRPWDMASYGGPVLRVRGNKQQFWLRVRTLGIQDEDYFSVTFIAEEDWTTIRIPWKTLRQSGRGKQMAFHARDIVGFDIYTRARSGEVFYQLDLDSIRLFE